MMVENKNNMSNLIDDIENSENTLIKKSKKQKTAIIVLSIILAVITGILAFLVYTNYDYLLFKVIMTQGYVYEDSLQDTIDEELEQSDSDITAYFDDAVINVFMDRLYETSGDRYSYLYLPAQYTARITSEQEEGNNCVWYPFTDDTACLVITNFTNESEAFVKENAQELSQYDNLILDLGVTPEDMFQRHGQSQIYFWKKVILFQLKKRKSAFYQEQTKHHQTLCLILIK